jgi:hypothetical protein
MTRESLKAASLVGAVVLTLGLASFAHADSPVPHKERTNGQIVNLVLPDGVNPGRMDFVGNGFATHMGNYVEVGGHDFYPDGTLVGEFESTAADGSTISGIYYGTFHDIGGGFAQFDVTAEWLEGTGRLDGVTGIGSVVAILDTSTGMFHFVADGTWNLK